MPAKAKIDITGTDAVSNVLMTLLNTFPGLTEQQRIAFATLEESSGIAFFPTAGAMFTRDIEDIIGHVKQTCVYPFSVAYRTAPKTEAQRMRVKEFLDLLGKWLEKEPVTVGEETYKLTDYPALSAENRIIKTISRTSPAYINGAYQDGVEDWVITLRLQYENEFDR